MKAITKTELFEIALTPRYCECCGGSDLEHVWSNRSIVAKAKRRYAFNVQLVICRTCGFCFTSPCASAQDLETYHADGLSGYKSIGLPYSIETRVSLLQQHTKPGGTLIEVGGDNPTEFHRRCGGLFKNLFNVNPALDSPAEFRSVKQMLDNGADAIVHYDVLEHVREVREFLRHCHRALKDNGVMICEVPDLRMYHRNLLLMEFEHVNHFSSATLTAIGMACGFIVVQIAHLCSRPFSFAMVFRKSADPTMVQTVLPYEYLDAVSCVRDGLRQIDTLHDKINAVRTRMREIATNNGRITLWAVSDMTRRLLEDFRDTTTTVVVDSDPRRKEHLKEYGIEVHLPTEQRQHIRESELIVILAPRYRSEILDWIIKNNDEYPKCSQIEVIGCGPSGESLV